MNKKLQFGLVAIFPLVSLLIIGCANSNESKVNLPRTMALVTHCKQMPEMQGCDDILESEESIINTENDSSNLVVRTDSMSDLPCHIMNRQIMGQCSPEDIDYLKKGYKERVLNKEFETFMPGSDFLFSELSEEQKSTIVEIDDQEPIELEAQIITKVINGIKIKMYGYNGQIPGPLLRVEQNSTIYVKFTNNIDLNTTIHWHGLRLDNAFDGVPDATQEPVQPGDSFVYKLFFPDEGIYWYHPHIREDIQQDSGLYGNILVSPALDGYYNPVNNEEVLILDDILIENGEIFPYGKDHANYAIMGRFGNVMLLNGETDYEIEVKKGDVVRFYISNVANVRPFNLSFADAKIKLIGSDVGNYEREIYVNSVVIAPAERYTIEVLFDKEKEYQIKNINPHNTYILGRVKVFPEKTNSDHSEAFNKLQANNHIIEEIDKYRQYFDKPIDYDMKLTVEMPSMIMAGLREIEEKKIEWEDEMGEMNQKSTAEDVKWIIRDNKTGNKNIDIDYNFKVGDVVKIRIFNDPNSMHPMQHPIHLHGQRFLVLEEDGIKNNNLVWKDTVLVSIGSTVDILLDVTNPGIWMAHCHIAEHLESGMMFDFQVSK